MSAPQTPKLTVDIVIELGDQNPRSIVLIERGRPPSGWALPGGFVDIGETVEAAARREAKEETGLDVRLTHLLGVYSDPQRDPRGHTVSICYVARASGHPVGQDDARTAQVFNPNRIEVTLAFDHHRIIADYLHFIAHNATPPLRGE